MIERRLRNEEVDVPDFTAPIMDRLGYERVDPAAVRQRRRRRLVGRGTGLMLALVTIVAGLATMHFSGATRRPTGPTIPAALGHDLELHQQRITNVLRSIRERTDRALPALPAPNEADDEHTPAPLDDDVDRSAVAAVSWV